MNKSLISNSVLIRSLLRVRPWHRSNSVPHPRCTTTFRLCSITISLAHTHTNNTHWHSPPPAPLCSAFALSLAHAQHTLSLATRPITLCLHSLTVLLDHPHCLCLLEPQLCTEVCKSAALWVPALQGVATLLQYYKS